MFLSRWLVRPVGHQICQLRAWKPGFLSQESSTKHPQPGILSQESSARFLSQDSSARSLQPGVLSQESSARSPQPGFFGPRIPQPGVSSQSVFGLRWSHIRMNPYRAIWTEEVVLFTLVAAWPWLLVSGYWFLALGSFLGHWLLSLVPEKWGTKCGTQRRTGGGTHGAQIEVHLVTTCLR